MIDRINSEFCKKIVTIEDGADWELYNLSTDRGETNNLAEENKDKLEEMVELWEFRRNEIIEQISD